MRGIAARIASEFPATNAEAGLRLAPLQATAMDDVRRNVIWLTMGLAVVRDVTYPGHFGALDTRLQISAF
jgi:hypothetical protein